MSISEKSLRPPSMRPGVAFPIAVYAILVCVRMPNLVTGGRFWAEEGQVFFHNAWTLPPGAALLTSYAGYLNLAVNASTLAARWLMPLAAAPYLTLIIALSFQLCAPLLLLTARDPWLHRGHVRVAACLLLLFAPGSDEIWLQTLHAQIDLLLCCTIILCLDEAAGARARWRLALLVVAPLCGPLPIALLPLFLLRAVIARSRYRLAEFAALGFGAAIQLTFFFHAIPGRNYSLDPLILLCVMTVRHLYVPFLGVKFASAAAAAIQARLVAGNIPWIAVGLPLIFLPLLFAASIRQGRLGPAFWLLLACGITAGAAYFGAIGGTLALVDGRFGQRYAYVPQLCLALALLALTQDSTRLVSRLCWCVVGWLLIVGFHDYWHPWTITARGPSWRHEISLWRKDPAHPVRIWPDGWSMTLPPHERP